jgi:hypothetical protein
VQKKKIQRSGRNKLQYTNIDVSIPKIYRRGYKKNEKLQNNEKPKNVPKI